MLDLFGVEVVKPPSTAKYHARIKDERGDLFCNRPPNEQEKMIEGLQLYVLDQMLDDLEQSFADMAERRRADPKAYWSALMAPKSAEEREARDDVIVDVRFVLEKHPVFLAAMAERQGCVDAYIDNLRVAFPNECKFVEAHIKGGALFVGEMA